MENPGTAGSRWEPRAGFDLLQRATRDLQRLRVTRGRSQRTMRQIRDASANLGLALALLAAPGMSSLARAADPNYCFHNLVNGFGLAGVGSYSQPAFADIDGDGDVDVFIGEGSRSQTNTDGDSDEVCFVGFSEKCY